MHAWTNDNTGHNRTIDTGPAPNGKPGQLLITVNYVQENGAGNIHKAIALDGHIIPLILRVPEMRDTLREIGLFLRAVVDIDGESMEPYDKRRYAEFIAKCEALTAPTREEAEQGA